MCNSSRFLNFKSALQEVDYSIFRNLNEVVSYQIDLEKLAELESTYHDPDLIVSTPEFHYLFSKYKNLLN